MSIATVDELRHCFKAAWASLLAHAIQSPLDSMPRRKSAVITATDPIDIIFGDLATHARSPQQLSRLFVFPPTHWWGITVEDIYISQQQPPDSGDLFYLVIMLLGFGSIGCGFYPSDKRHYRCPGVKYPKVIAFYYGTTHQNVMNCSPVDWKSLRDFLGLVRSDACACIIRQSQTINLIH
ncbi:hypothetical protein TNCV_5074591 [Trichonephila clavipes]|nr:hypothetical protein TNCV_5074591 [Trichonephila clavipes]